MSGQYVVPVSLEKLNESWRTNKMPSIASKNEIVKMDKKGEIPALKSFAIMQFDADNETHLRISNDRYFCRKLRDYLKTLVAAQKKGKVLPFMEGLVRTEHPEDSEKPKWEGKSK